MYSRVPLSYTPHLSNNDHSLDLNRSENKLPREKLSVT